MENISKRGREILNFVSKHLITLIGSVITGLLITIGTYLYNVPAAIKDIQKEQIANNKETHRMDSTLIVIQQSKATNDLEIADQMVNIVNSAINKKDSANWAKAEKYFKFFLDNQNANSKMLLDAFKLSFPVSEIKTRGTNYIKEARDTLKKNLGNITSAREE
jgi:hypothetical protein